MEKECIKCHKIVKIDLTDEQLRKIENKEDLIQRIMPNGQYTKEQREMFLSGLCQECWDELFLKDEDEISQAAYDQLFDDLQNYDHGETDHAEEE